MKKGQEGKSGMRFLPWPWNVVVYVLLAVCLRLFAIPFILLLIWLRNKNNPHGAAEGYCLSHTRKRLSWLGWALLCLVIGLALGGAFLVGLEQDRAYWEAADYVTLVVAGGGMVLFVAGGLYLGFVAVRDTFFPARSGLAQSIRLQLPYPDEAPEVGKLFAMVDDDLRDNGQWFGPVGIGREWVLGDLANRIDRIRGIFTVDEIHRHHTQTGTRTSRTIQLILIDDCWQKNVTNFNNPKDMQAAADCLALRVPEAARGHNNYTGFWTMKEEEQEAFEREFRRKQSLRREQRSQNEITADSNQGMILQARGEVTSRVTPELLARELEHCLQEGQGSLTLTPSRPIEAQGKRLGAMSARAENGNVTLTVEVVPAAGAQPSELTRTMEPRQAEELLKGWLGRQAPDMGEWQQGTPAPKASAQRPERESKARLALVFASGAAESHTTFTREDVQVAAEGLESGTYQIVDITLPQGYLRIRAQAGEKGDGLCTVEATRPDADKLRLFSAQMPAGQAVAWLMGYPYGEFLPGGESWKDITKQMEKANH